jgi:hypothetical protein
VVATSTYNASACRELGLGFGGLGVLGAVALSFKAIICGEIFRHVFFSAVPIARIAAALTYYNSMLKNLSPLTISPPKKQLWLASPLTIKLQTYNSVHAAATGCNILQHDLLTKSKHKVACLLAIVPTTKHHTIYHTERGLQYCC